MPPDRPTAYDTPEPLLELIVTPVGAAPESVVTAIVLILVWLGFLMHRLQYLPGSYGAGSCGFAMAR